MSIILNNALTNAIEGVSGHERHICIESYRDKNAYMVKVRNSFAGEFVVDGDTGLPESSKEDRLEHGYGLTNIRKVAQKYHGEMTVWAENGEFVLTVMLMCP